MAEEKPGWSNVSRGPPVPSTGYGQAQEASYGYGGQETTATSQKQSFPSIDQNGPSSGSKASNIKDKILNFKIGIRGELMVCKTFYFFFFSAFGSLFPLLGIYFKQLGMNPFQAGVLIGLRPLIEIGSGPFWGSFADKWRRGRQLLLFSLFCWIAFTLALAFIYPPANSCIAKSVKSDNFSLVKPWADHSKKDTYPIYLLPHPRLQALGMSPLPLAGEKFQNVKDEDLYDLVSPHFSSVVYKTGEVQRVFLVVLFVMLFGEFFSAPAITLADAATIGLLESSKDAEFYGRQRMYGSFGWGLAMFIVGIALDHSHIFPDHPCGETQLGERNYAVCFAVFCVLMGCALVTATQFRFAHDKEGAKIDLQLADLKEPGKVLQKVTNAFSTKNDEENDMEQNEKQVKISLEPNQQNQMIGDVTCEADTVTHSVFIPRGKPGQSGTMPSWLEVLKLYGTVFNGATLFLTWFIGFGGGVLFTFLFWHLQDLGGTPTLFGIISIVNHISELVAFVYSKRLILRFGHAKVLFMGLGTLFIRFLAISFITAPWGVLPFELLPGLSHAAVWAACCSYMTRSIPPHLRATAQFLLQAIYHGLGRGCGAILGGAFIYSMGTQNFFRGYAVTALLVTIALIGIAYMFPQAQAWEDAQADREKGLGDETQHLAPCGVPMNPMTQQRLQESSYGSNSAQQPPSYPETRNEQPVRVDQNYDQGYDQGYGGGAYDDPTPQSYSYDQFVPKR